MSAHQDCAQFSVGLNQREEPGPIKLNDLAVLGYAQASKRAAARDQVRLACELAGTVRDNDRLHAPRGGRHQKVAAHDDEKWRCLADLDQHLTLRRLSAQTLRRDPVDVASVSVGKSRSACEGGVGADGRRGSGAFIGRPPPSLSASSW
jgi:hypothetical protein